MTKLLRVLTFLLSFSPVLANAGWHSIYPVTQVTVFEKFMYVKGGSPTGEVCTNLHSFYGTLYADSAAFNEMYALALTAQVKGRGLTCHIYVKDGSGVCKMENCYMP